MNRNQVRIEALDDDPAPLRQPEWIGVVISIWILLR